MNYISTVTQKGQVTIPVDIRRFFGIKPYQRVIFEKIKNKIIIRPSQNFLSLKGSVKSRSKFSDKGADKKIKEFIAKKYAEKNSRS